MCRLSFLIRTNLLLASFALVAALGCGGPAAPKREYADVSGKITYKGKPLEVGQVIFQPPTGAAVVAELDSEGAYSLKGVIGPNKVMVQSRDEMGETDANDPKSRQMPRSNIPDQYGLPDSGLKFDVEAGDNTADFDLK